MRAPDPGRRVVEKFLTTRKVARTALSLAFACKVFESLLYRPGWVTWSNAVEMVGWFAEC